MGKLAIMTNKLLLDQNIKLMLQNGLLAMDIDRQIERKVGMRFRLKRLIFLHF